MKKHLKKIILLSSSIVLLAAGCKSTVREEKAFEEPNLKWWQETIVYEAYPSSFKDTDGDGCGDLRGLTEKLDYLQSLGVGAVWLTPVYASPMGDNGYDVSDYYSINPRYGTMKDMDELIAKAKEKNIRIVMDLVFNHTSNESEWFKESSKDRTNDKNDWYIWRDAAPDGGAPNNWRGIFGESAWTWNEARQQYYLHTFADFQPDLNWENPDVRQALYDIANFWTGKGVGGFRLDAVTYIKKPHDFLNGEPDGPDSLSGIHKMTANTDGILDYLSEFKQNVQQGKDIFTVGEANGVPVEELDKWIGKNGVLDMIFNFDLVNIQFTQGEIWCKTRDFKLTEFKKIITETQNNTGENGWASVFFENHDQPRSVNHFLPPDADPVLGAKALGTVLLTLRGTPFMYEGEEIGMMNVNRESIDEYNDISSHNQYKNALRSGLSDDEALKCVQRFSRDNARSPMQWDTTENAGFTVPGAKPWLPVADNYIKINVASETDDKSSVLSWYRELNRLRCENRVLINGDYHELLPESEEIVAYTRSNGKNTATVLVNFTGKTVSYDSALVNGSRLILSAYENSQTGVLQPYEAVCYIK